MKDKITASFMALTLSMPVYSSMFGEETAVLIEIASTTASQLNELEQTRPRLIPLKACGLSRHDLVVQMHGTVHLPTP